MIAIRRNICKTEAVVPESKTIKVLHSRINTVHASMDIEETKDRLMTVLKDDMMLFRRNAGKLTVIKRTTIEPNNSRIRISIQKM